MKELLFFMVAASAWAAHGQHGSVVLEQQNCLECHTVNAEGIGHEPNATAPDLGAMSKSAYPPSALASAVWNHTPAMWNEIAAKELTRPVLAEADWEDLFAYLYSEQIFQFPAGTRRGQEVFRSKKCADCHSLAEPLTKPSRGLGPPVSAWKKLDDPAALAYQMWNHASSMQKVSASSRKDWPKLDGKDFMDLSAYFQYVQKVAQEQRFSLPDSASGKTAFGHNCEQCHQGPLALETHLANKTFLDIGAAMWNHVPLMGPFPRVSETDMRKILAYVWELQCRGPAGNITRGQLAFAAKGCVVCHSDAETKAELNRSGKTLTPFSMAAIAWGPNRAMHQRMQDTGVNWPALSPQNISDLTAYLNYSSRK